jgi:hypothetical protein
MYNAWITGSKDTATRLVISKITNRGSAGPAAVVAKVAVAVVEHLGKVLAAGAEEVVVVVAVAKREVELAVAGAVADLV